MTQPAGDFEHFLLWERSSRDSLEVKRVYIDMAGDLVAGIVLSQIVYWHLPSREGRTRLQVKRDGRLWLAKARADWWGECRVSPKQADRALAALEAKGLVEVRLFRFNGSPTKHVRIVPENFLRLWQAQLTAAAREGEGSGTAHDPGRTRGPILPEGESRFSARGHHHVPGRGKSLTQTTTETSTASAEPSSASHDHAAADALAQELVSRGVGRAVARRLAGEKPEACRRYLEYLPYADCRTTPGAWLANAIRDEYGPPEGYLRAKAAAAAAERRRQDKAARREKVRRQRALREQEGDRLRERYERLRHEGGHPLAAFERFVEQEKAKLRKILAGVSPSRRAEQLAELDSPNRRVQMFARWLESREWDAGGNDEGHLTDARR